ncbi:MAG: carbon storage regulator [Mariniblastus sp.]
MVVRACVGKVSNITALSEVILLRLKETAMLVLSRHRDESIMIGDNVMITIVDIRGDKVRLGIDAPQEIPVHRQEVYDAIKRENEKASRLGPSETRDIGK